MGKGQNMKIAKRTVAVVAAMGVVLSACGSDDESGLTAELSEWSVELSSSSIDAGEVTITADNMGGENHELVIVRADSPDDLPFDASTGKVVEDDLAEEDFIGEIEEFEAGTKASQVFDLEAGTYILFCNLAETEDDGTLESHFEEGMVTTLTVG